METTWGWFNWCLKLATLDVVITSGSRLFQISMILKKWKLYKFMASSTYHRHFSLQITHMPLVSAIIISLVYLTLFHPFTMCSGTSNPHQLFFSRLNFGLPLRLCLFLLLVHLFHMVCGICQTIAYCVTITWLLLVVCWPAEQPNGWNLVNLSENCVVRLNM